MNVMITRHYNGFVNVQDKLSLGNNEADGNAAATLYRLPDGYTVADGCIYDTADIECALVLEGDEVKLISLAGKCADQILEAA